MKKIKIVGYAIIDGIYCADSCDFLRSNEEGYYCGFSGAYMMTPMIDENTNTFKTERCYDCLNAEKKEKKEIKEEV